MIPVTKTYLPPIEEYLSYIQKIWAGGQITNHGPLVRELEMRLKEYLGVKHLFLVTNGTIALQIAIKALGLKNEIITTPLSYVATTSSIVWEGCAPVFADIENDTLTINPREIEKKISKKTTGIITTHVYGNPCDIEAIDEISKKNNLKVIYDAAHAFGVRYREKALVSYGDISVLSFHATKIFHTIEGGALITHDDEMAHKISYMRNFGHDGEESFFGLGINGKMSEFQAAMGLCILPHINEVIERRRLIHNTYDELLDFDRLSKPVWRGGANHNYAYYPVLFQTEQQLLATRELLRKNNIYPRRYFYPPLNTLAYIKKQPAQVTEDISRRILCLPLSHDLKKNEGECTANTINKSIKRN